MNELVRYCNTEGHFQYNVKHMNLQTKEHRLDIFIVLNFKNRQNSLRG